MSDTTPHKPEWAQSRRERENAARIAAGQPPRRRARWPWLVLLVLVLAGIGYLVYQSRQAPPAAAPAAPAPAERVMQINPLEITTLEPQLLVQTVKVTGSLAPRSRAEVASQVSGQLLSVEVRPGDHVAAGQALAQVDVRDLQVMLNQQLANRAATQAQLDLARTQLNTASTLAQRGLTPQSSLEEAQSNVAALESQVAALDAGVVTAQRALENATVRSPIAGTVSSRAVEPGQAVQPGTALFSIVDLSVMDVQASAPLSATALLKPGQRVDVAVEGIPGQVFEGRVDRINPVAIENTRSISVYVSLENPDNLFRGGMFATGQIVVAEAPGAIALPAAAIREDAEGDYVLKIADGKALRQAVETGGTWNNGNLVQITAGLAAGDVVVTARLEELQANAAVAIVED